MDKLIEVLDETLQELVNDQSMTWSEKAAKVKAGVNETALEEFLAWFPDEAD